MTTNANQPGEPVAWMYEREDGSRDLVLDCNGEYARRLLELGATETALYTRPAPVDGLLQDMITLDVFLAAYADTPDEDVIASAVDPDDDLLTLGALRRILTVLRNQSDAEVERGAIRKAAMEEAADAAHGAIFDLCCKSPTHSPADWSYAAVSAIRALALEAGQHRKDEG